MKKRLLHSIVAASLAACVVGWRAQDAPGTRPATEPSTAPAESNGVVVKSLEGKARARIDANSPWRLVDYRNMTEELDPADYVLAG